MIGSQHARKAVLFRAPPPELYLHDWSWPLEALVSLIALVLLSPLFAIIAVGIKLTSDGPVFYRGERLGRGRRVFTIYKFRTLRPGAEQEIGARLLRREERTTHATQFGRFLKRSKLDEIPQLFNVIRGEMRLVGPRPIRPIFLETLRLDPASFEALLSVPPGLTGIAQVRGGYYTSPRAKLRYGLSYVRNRSLWLDLKIILLTLLKVFDRWLRMGLVALFVFLLVSFVPSSVQESLRFHIWGMPIDAVYLLILLAAAQPLSRKGLTHFHLYRGPLNRAIVAFLAFGVLSAVVSDYPSRFLQATGYYVVTGFLVSFMLVNALAADRFAPWIVRGIALTPVLMSLIGLLEIALPGVAAEAAAPLRAAQGAGSRMSSVLGNPMLLAVYLVLGIPLLLAEVGRARSRGERDFWVVCTTISVIGILFTQTRTGLVALLVSGTFFLSRRWIHATVFSGILVTVFVLLSWLGVPRLAPSTIGQDARVMIAEQSPVLFGGSLRDWLVGTGPHEFWWRVPDGGLAKYQDDEQVPNMYLTLAREQGIGAFLVMMWLIGAVVRRMKKAYDRLTDPREKILLWAILSCIPGLLVSMSGMNVFHDLTLQVFFWSLVGIGLSIANHAPQQRTRDLIWRFGDAGDD
jgi:lipopolysaccharide/colanic/teichoic acid biosynthesis glycosyltransferase